MKTLKSKFSLVYIGLVLLIAVVGCFSVLKLAGLERSVDALMTNNYQSITAAQSMQNAIEQQNSAILTYISVDPAKGIKMFSENSRVFLKWYNFESGNVTEKGEKSIVDDINTCYGDFDEMFSVLQEIRNSKGKPAALSYYNGAVSEKLRKIKGQLSELSLLNERAMFQSKKSASNNAKLSVYILLILSFAAVIGGFVVSGFFVNRFLAPLHLLSQSISKVREGGLNQKIDISTKDEIGMLSKEFNEMTKRLLSYEQSTMGRLLSEKNKSVAIVKSISDPFIVLDKNYKITLINKACEHFFHIKEDQALSRHFLQSIKNGDLFDFISSCSSSDGGKVQRIMKIGDAYFNVIAVILKDASKNPDGFIVLLQNVTELKEVERIKSDFVAAISHELKTPLTSVLMGASMLQDQEIGRLTEEQESVVKAIAEDGEKLSDFVSEILEISKIESGRAVYHFEPCSVSAAVENSYRQFAAAAQQKGIAFHNLVKGGLPLVYADFEKVIWVINNLLSNALKYTNDGDSVSVDARAENDMVCVSVSDTGVGIPKEYLDKIFEKYFRVEDNEIEVRGTGIGLSVAKEIILAHKGEIRAESETDSGSVFRFTLPVYREMRQ